MIKYPHDHLNGDLEGYVINWILREVWIMKATHVVRWYGGTVERVAIIEDRTDQNRYAFGRYGEMRVWSEKTGSERLIDFGLYNAIGIEPLGAELHRWQ